MTESVDVGVVGLGGMGTGHARRVRDLGHNVVAGADVSDKQRQEFTDEFAVGTYESHDEMYANESLDAVFITTPNAFHAPAATAALDRDLHVLCEKPLADSLEGAEEIATAAARSDGEVMVGFKNRFCAAAEIVDDLREEGRFGEITHVEANYIRRRGIPGVGSWFTTKDLSGGGALIDIGVHVVDFALYLSGFPEPVEVTGVTRSEFGTQDDYADPDDWAGNWQPEDGAFDVDDSASAFVRCADGTTLSVDVSWATNRDPEQGVVVRGTDAGARCQLGGDEVTVYESGTTGVDHYSDTTLEGSMDPSGTKAEVRQFLEAVQTGTAPEMNTVEEALLVQRVLDGIYRSAEQGAAVTIE